MRTRPATAHYHPAWAPACCLAAVLLTGFWYAPDPGGDGSGDADTALIDMAGVFKNYDRFNDARDDLKAEIEDESGDLKRLAKRIKELTADLKTAGDRGDQSDWTKRNLETAKEDYKAARKAVSEKFLRREAELYQDLYEEARAVIAEIAEERGYQLVIRYKAEPGEDEAPDDPKEILKGMNRLVVHTTLPDITDEVAERLND